MTQLKKIARYLALLFVICFGAGLMADTIKAAFGQVLDTTASAIDDLGATIWAIMPPLIVILAVIIFFVILILVYVLIKLYRDVTLT